MKVAFATKKIISAARRGKKIEIKSIRAWAAVSFKGVLFMRARRPTGKLSLVWCSPMSLKTPKATEYVREIDREKSRHKVFDGSAKTASRPVQDKQLSLLAGVTLRVKKKNLGPSPTKGFLLKETRRIFTVGDGEISRRGQGKIVAWGEVKEHFAAISS